MSLSTHIKNPKDSACLRATGSGVEYIDQLRQELTNCLKLCISYNSISSLENIIQFKRLNILLMQYNNLSTFESLLPLAKLRFLHTLRLEGNPVCNLSLFYLHVVHILPNLKILNGKKTDRILNEKNCRYLDLEIDLISHIINVHFIYEVFLYVLESFNKTDNSTTTTPVSKMSFLKSPVTPNKTNLNIFELMKDAIRIKKSEILESELYKQKITQKLRESNLPDEGYIGFLRQEILNYDQMIEECVSKLLRNTRVSQSQANNQTTTPMKYPISKQSSKQNPNDNSMNKNQSTMSDNVVASEINMFRFLLSNLKGEDDLDEFMARQVDIQASSYRLIGSIGGMELEPLPDSVKNSPIYSPNYSPIANQKQMNFSFENGKYNKFEEEEDDFADEIDASKIDPIPLTAINDDEKELFEPIHPKTNDQNSNINPSSQQRNTSLLNSDDDNDFENGNSNLDVSNQNNNSQIQKQTTNSIQDKQNDQQADNVNQNAISQGDNNEIQDQDDSNDQNESTDVNSHANTVHPTKEDDGEIDNELKQIVKNCDSSIMNKISSQIFEDEINEEEEDLSSNAEEVDKMANTITPLDTKQFSDELEAQLFSTESSENEEEENKIESGNRINQNEVDNNTNIEQQIKSIDSIQNEQKKSNSYNQNQQNKSFESDHNEQSKSTSFNQNQQNKSIESNQNEQSKSTSFNQNQQNESIQNEQNKINSSIQDGINKSNVSAQDENTKPSSTEIDLQSDQNSTDLANEFLFQNEEEENEENSNQKKNRNSSDEFAEYLDSQTDDEEKKNKQKPKRVVVYHASIEYDQHQNLSDNEKGYDINDVYNTATLSLDEKMQSNEDNETKPANKSPLQESSYHNDEAFDYSDNENTENTKNPIDNSITNFPQSNISSDMRFGGFASSEKLNNSEEALDNAHDKQINIKKESTENEKQPDDNYSFNTEEDDSDSFQRKIMNSIPKPILKNNEDQIQEVKNEESQPRRSISFNFEQLQVSATAQQANRTKQNKNSKKSDGEIDDMYFDASHGESMSSSNAPSKEQHIPLNETTDGTRFDASCGRFTGHESQPENPTKLRFELSPENPQNNEENLFLNNQDDDSYADESRDIFESIDQNKFSSKQKQSNKYDMSLNENNQTISREQFDLNNTEQMKSNNNIGNVGDSLLGASASAANEALNGRLDSHEIDHYDDAYFDASCGNQMDSTAQKVKGNASYVIKKSMSSISQDNISENRVNQQYSDLLNESLENSDLINKDDENEEPSSSRAGTSSAVYQRQKNSIVSLNAQENASSSRADIDSNTDFTVKNYDSIEISICPTVQLLKCKLFNLWKSKTSQLNKQYFSNDSGMRTTTAVSFSNSYVSSFVSNGSQGNTNNYDYIKLFTEKRDLLRKIDNQRDLNNALKGRIAQYKKEASASQKYNETMSMSPSPQSPFITYERIPHNQPQNFTPLQFPSKKKTQRAETGTDIFTQYRNHILKSTDDE